MEKYYICPQKNNGITAQIRPFDFVQYCQLLINIIFSVPSNIFCLIPESHPLLRVRDHRIFRRSKATSASTVEFQDSAGRRAEAVIFPLQGYADLICECRIV